MSKDKWADYWENESETGECFVSATGKKHPELVEYWQSQFESLDSGAKVLDIASGAGSIFTSIPERNDLSRFASDLSFNALRKQQQRNPNTHLITSAADTQVFAPESFDMVVSQFGIEYAPKEAFKIANEVLKPAGKLVFLCHIEDGYIDEKNRREKEGIDLTKSTSFIATAVELTRAMYAGKEADIQALLKNFQEVEPVMAKFAQQQGQGLQQHLYNGYRSMMQSMQNYICDDIVGWLLQMEGEMFKIELRLNEMINAAQNRTQVSEIAKILVSSGTEQLQIAPFHISAHERPIAWQIIASKSQSLQTSASLN